MKRVAAQNLADWYAKALETNGAPYDAEFVDKRSGRKSPNQIFVPIALLNDLLRESTEIKARRQRLKDDLRMH